METLEIIVYPVWVSTFTIIIMSLNVCCTPAVTVNVGRAGAASLDVIQEVEYVKQEAKVVYLLECLQKTPPPVRIHSMETLIRFFLLLSYVYVGISVL